MAQNTAELSERIVIKVGSSSLYGPEGPRLEIFDSIAGQVYDLKQSGVESAIVSSGAIAFGRAVLQRSAEVESVPVKQMLAAVGQPVLMDYWQQAFKKLGIFTGQVLVTDQELFGILKGNKSPLSGMLNTMFSNNLVPIVNENDAVATEEITQGDNDKLSAFVGKIIGASELYLLGTASALFQDYPKNELRIPVVSATDTDTIVALCHPTQDPIARGGMITKIDAVNIANNDQGKNMNVYIASAFENSNIIRARQGKIGTLFTRR